MNIAEMFILTGFKIDEASVAKFDKMVKDAEKGMGWRAKAERGSAERMVQQLMDRVVAYSRDQAKATKEVHEFIEAASAIAGDPVKAMETARRGLKRFDEQAIESARQKKDWAQTIVAAEAAWNLLSGGIEWARGKLTGFLGELATAGGKAGTIADLSERTGIATDTLQELGYAAEQNGGDMATLATGLKSITNKADAAAAGSKSAAKAFREVGVSGKDLKDGKLSLDDALGTIADKFANMPDGAKKAALAMDLFGGAGGKLIPLLNKGKGGIEDLRKEARDLGVVLDKEAITSFDALDDSTAKLKTTFGALRTQALAAVVPMMQKLVGRVQEWLAVNKDDFVGALTLGFRAMAGALSVVADVAGVAVQVFGFLSEHSEAVEFAVLSLTIALAAYGIVALATSKVSIIAAASAAAAWVVAAGPFILIGAAVAALILYWDEVVGAVGTAIDAIQWLDDLLLNGLLTAIEFVGDVSNRVFAWIYEDALPKIGEWLKKIGYVLLHFIPFAAIVLHWSKIKDGAKAAVDKIADIFKSVKDAVIWPFKTAWAWIEKKFDDGVKWIQGMVSKLPGFMQRAIGIQSVTGADTRGSGQAPITGTSSAPMPVPSALVPSSSQQSTRSTVIQNSIPITVTSSAADPAAVGREVRTQFEGMWQTKMRETED